MSHQATKVVIITEKIIAGKVAQMIEECGGQGYTITAAGGKGSRGVRRQQENTLFDTSANVKIEIITGDSQIAEKIAQQVADEYFSNYAGITYLEDVRILRPQKF